MTNPKRHHYVPQMLLNSFTDEEGWLHWCRRDEDEPVIRPARPSELFLKNHLYSIIAAGGGKDPAIEIALSKLETKTVPVVQKMIEAARAERLPDLTEEEKYIWYHFFSMQWRRTPESQQSAASDDEISAMFDDSIARLRELLPRRRNDIDALDTDEGRTRTIRNVRAESLTQFSDNVAAVLAQRGIGILGIRKPNRSFIVGSRPVVKFTIKGQSDLRNPIVEMWLPIAYDVAVGVGNATGQTSLYFADEDEPIRRLNLAIAKQSRIIAARSADLVRSIMNPR